jgi:hypothetical protein
VSAKIDYYFKDSHIVKGNTQKDIENNYQKFTDEVKIIDWYLQRKAELEEIIKAKNYSKILSVYNDKGLRAIVNKNFKISDFTNKAIRFLRSSKKAQDILRTNFPKDL